MFLCLNANLVLNFLIRLSLKFEDIFNHLQFLRIDFLLESVVNTSLIQTNAPVRLLTIQLRATSRRHD